MDILNFSTDGPQWLVLPDQVVGADQLEQTLKLPPPVSVSQEMLKYTEARDLNQQFHGGWNIFWAVDS